MRHGVAGVKLGRSTAHRRALFRNLVTALLEHEVVRTTDAKAKELRRWADRMITLGKQGTLHARRRAATVVRRRSVLKKLFDELAPRFDGRAGGYTRVVKLGVRRGDAAALSLVELVERAGAEEGRAGQKEPARAGAAGRGEAPGRATPAGGRGGVTCRSAAGAVARLRCRAAGVAIWRCRPGRATRQRRRATAPAADRGRVPGRRPACVAPRGIPGDRAARGGLTPLHVCLPRS